MSAIGPGDSVFIPDPNKTYYMKIRVADILGKWSVESDVRSFNTNLEAGGTTFPALKVYYPGLTQPQIKHPEGQDQLAAASGPAWNGMDPFVITATDYKTNPASAAVTDPHAESEWAGWESSSQGTQIWAHRSTTALQSLTVTPDIYDIAAYLRARVTREGGYSGMRFSVRYKSRSGIWSKWSRKAEIRYSRRHDLTYGG